MRPYAGKEKAKNRSRRGDGASHYGMARCAVSRFPIGTMSAAMAASLCGRRSDFLITR